MSQITPISSGCWITVRYEKRLRYGKNEYVKQYALFKAQTVISHQTSRCYSLVSRSSSAGLLSSPLPASDFFAKASCIAFANASTSDKAQHHFTSTNNSEHQIKHCYNSSITRQSTVMDVPTNSQNVTCTYSCINERYVTDLSN